MTKIGVLVGSLRKESITKKLAANVVDLFPNGYETEIIEIGDLPLYNQDYDDYNDIPEEGVLSKTIEKYLSGYEGNGKEETKFYFIFGFIVPLLLVWLYDYYRIRPSLKRIVKK